jgi:hypothetical protein
VSLESPELLDPSSRQLVFETMARVGSSLSISEFFSVVVSAHQQAQNSVMPNHDMHNQFKKSDSYEGFLDVLRFAVNDLARPCSVLVIGAGAGYAGCSSDYTRDVIRELDSKHVETVESLELTPEMLHGLTFSKSSTYDLVVSHSLAHFVPTLASFFALVSACVKGDGTFVMGHEFNADFWVHPGIAHLRRSYQRRKRLQKIVRKATSPSTYVRRIKATIGGTVSRSMPEVVNAILRDQHGFKDRLTPSEISALVDPHLPNGSTYHVGLNGMDAVSIQHTYLPEFRLTKLYTSEFPGLDAQEAIRRKLPGRIFHAVYQRTPRQ